MPAGHSGRSDGVSASATDGPSMSTTSHSARSVAARRSERTPAAVGRLERLERRSSPDGVGPLVVAVDDRHGAERLGARPSSARDQRRDRDRARAEEVAGQHGDHLSGGVPQRGERGGERPLAGVDRPRSPAARARPAPPASPPIADDLGGPGLAQRAPPPAAAIASPSTLSSALSSPHPAARPAAQDGSGEGDDGRAQPRSAGGHAGSSWRRNSAQRSASSSFADGRGRALQAGQGPEEATVAGVLPAHVAAAAPSVRRAGCRARGGSRPGRRRSARSRLGRRRPAGPSPRASGARRRPPRRGPPDDRRRRGRARRRGRTARRPAPRRSPSRADRTGSASPRTCPEPTVASRDILRRGHLRPVAGRERPVIVDRHRRGSDSSRRTRPGSSRRSA